MIGTLSESGEVRNFLPPFNKEEIQQWLNQHEEIIGHNFIDFDSVQLNKFLGISFDGIKIVDTLILSRLYNPQLEGGHSLRAWGDRLNFPKGEHSDFNSFSPEMEQYCIQDLKVTQKLYNILTDKLASFGDTSIDLEHQVQSVVTQQIQNGWTLDQKKCWDLLATLKERKIQLEDEVHEKFKPLPVFIKEIHPKYKKNGELSNVGIKFLGDEWRSVCGPFSRIDLPEFNLGSRQQIGRHLQYFGWKPDNFTEKGHVIVDEAILSKVVGIPEAQLISEYLLIQKRHAQIQSWLDAVEEDGRVRGYVNTIGAVTGRMTHSSPNMSQVPASYSPYGTECRSCWTVPKGRKLVGADASGIELRMLAHYMNDKEYTHEILHGDIHSANQKAAGLTTRDTAKTFIYAFLYGAGDRKIGSIVGGSATDGARLKTLFLDNTPSLRDLRERVERATVRGHLRGLDNRKLIIRSNHAALNTLLQSAASVVMKKSLTILDEYAKIYGIDYKFVGNIHDEFQAEVREDQAEKFGWLAVECIKAAGIKFNLRCPLDGEYKVGKTWADTH
jgi:DNA polymerase I-like protein with 3'-5' exonuclease and polymerase domains|tara:strand:- start:615 stop:2282 length:1668 start_codon:yes stop_codon:yes gene_type:complete